MVGTTMLHVRVDNETKAEVAKALAAMGLSMSAAIRLFLHRVAADKALPFEVKVPNAETTAALEEAEQIVRAHRARFATADALLDNLEKANS
jgi:DNA-damage-inducible protein J